jgi:transcriptional regulator with XRE-family HTH domain
LENKASLGGRIMEAITRKDPMTITLTPGGAMTEQPVPQPRTLADLRRAAGMSLTQVAERMGIQKSRVAHIEARYPNLNYETLTRYITALGGSVQFTVGTAHAYADQMIPDPEKRGTRKYLMSRPGMGSLVYQPSTAEELPLQSNQTDTGGDDTGGQIDHPDAESDQSDSGQRQQP